MDLSGVHVLEPGVPAIGELHAREGFRRVFGAAAGVVSRAPGRVNLMGEHTDYNRGTTLPIALRHATYVAAAPRSDDMVRLASAAADGIWTGRLDEIGPGRVTGWAAYAAGIAWAMRREGIDIPGADIFVHSTVPLGAGLSSSAALEAAVATAWWVAAGHDPDEMDRAQLVDVCIDAETEVAGAPTGGMDQIAALLSSPGAALFIDFDEFTCYDVALPLGDAELLVVDSAVRHQLTDGSYGNRRGECERAAAALGVSSLRAADQGSVAGLTDPVLRRRARHVVSEIGRVASVIDAFDHADPEQVGRIFNESHASLRDDFEVSCPQVDALAERLLAAGAYGARMTGGGFGGSLVAILPRERVAPACLAAAAAFRASGWEPPRFLRLSPSEPAAARPLGD